MYDERNVRDVSAKCHSQQGRHVYNITIQVSAKIEAAGNTWSLMTDYLKTKYD